MICPFYTIDRSLGRNLGTSCRDCTTLGNSHWHAGKHAHIRHCFPNRESSCSTNHMMSSCEKNLGPSPPRIAGSCLHAHAQATRYGFMLGSSLGSIQRAKKEGLQYVFHDDSNGENCIDKYVNVAMIYKGKRNKCCWPGMQE